ncbi:MAG TPA: family 10 glycosylhydrolase [Verrucomicrobiae bacterium]|jgi:uncharacterized lipoprotein YddW (UPF0748 family)
MDKTVKNLCQNDWGCVLWVKGMNWKYLIAAAGLCLSATILFAADTNSPAANKIFPPPPLREFRAEWVATVGNSCWPSKPGLTTAQQKSELIAILDRAVALKLNAIIFQVRPACDALYDSKIEPWSEYLTGVQGRAPSPYYDPLAFAITEAHKRGLELHAWFNPFRAHHFQAVSPIAPNHISKTQPQLVRNYSRYLWLDPGDPAVRAYSQRVVMDVVKRYDVDGVHFDDYFYPYHEKNSAGQDIDFPDGVTWRKFGVNSGLARDDWRRHNVDVFMEQMYHAIKAEKPWVKFGISPFGIWRPKNPPPISGFDSYAELYADSLKWLRSGWCDYLSPQLYWSIAAKAQSFSTLLGWWEGENSMHRHVWPGINSLKVGSGAGSWQPSEIINQITVTRRYPNPGHIHWSSSALMKNGALDAALQRDSYQQPALIPASPWLDAAAPAPPKLSVSTWRKTFHVQWRDATGEPARWWVLQARSNGNWTTQIFPASQADTYLDNSRAEAIAIRSVNRVGNLSAPTTWMPK